MVFHDVFVNVSETFVLLWKKKEKIIFPVVSELLFFIAVGFFGGPFLRGIFNNLLSTGDLIIGEANAASKNLWESVFVSESFRYVVILSVLLIITVYVLYCLFHGVIWRYCLGLCEKGVKYKTYLKRFFLVNILWYILYTLIYLVYFLLFYIDTVGRRINPAGFYYISVIPIFLLAIVVYFSLISYVLIYQNKAWISIVKSLRIGFRKFFWLVPNFLILILFFFVSNFLLYLIGLFSETLLIVGGLTIVMPLLVYSRIFIKKIVDKI